MCHEKLANPQASRGYDCKTYPDVAASAAGAQAMAGNGNRVTAWFALNGPVVLTQTQYVSIGVFENGKFRAITAINLNEPKVTLSIMEFGSVMQNALFVASAAVGQTVSCGDCEFTNLE